MIGLRKWNFSGTWMSFRSTNKVYGRNSPPRKSSMTAHPNNKIGNGQRKPIKILGIAVAIVAIGLAVVWLKVGQGSESPSAQLATFTAKQGPLTISVLEAGTIKAREQEIIYNEVEGRTSIVKIISEGAQVKKGDLLVKLDVSTLTDRRIDQEIGVQNAQASYINAKENFEIIKNQAMSDVNVAELTLQFARQDLKKYMEGQYPNQLAAARNDITLAEEELKRAEETLQWSQRLFTEKYLSQTELQADELARNRSKVKVEVAKNDLTLLQEYTNKRQIAQLESDVKQAEMSLERTNRKANANVVQAEADLNAKKQEFDRQTAKLAKLEDQLNKATILAPRDGMVIYATSVQQGGFHHENRQPLEEGVEVFERQELIYLPTAASSKAEISIHEASLEKVRLGLPAVITVDALPGKKFFGTLTRIAPLPDAQSMWMNPDLKVYISDVYLDTDDPALRTGMGCKVEVIVEQHEDAIYVPIEAVIRVKGTPTLYVVKTDGTIEERKVEIGLDNNSVVRIISGLKEGELVWTTPPLKEATVESGSNTAGGLGDSNDAADASRQRIRESLDAANEAQAGRPGVTSGRPFDGQADGEDRNMGDDAGQGQQGRGVFPAMTPEQRKQTMQNLTPEQRQQMEAMQQRMQNMTPEERAAMWQRFQQGQGDTQGRGQRQGGDRTSGAEQRPRGAEGNP
jgi:HlyD family secretion protein